MESAHRRRRVGDSLDGCTSQLVHLKICNGEVTRVPTAALGQAYAFFGMQWPQPQKVWLRGELIDLTVGAPTLFLQVLKKMSQQQRTEVLVEEAHRRTQGLLQLDPWETRSLLQPSQPLTLRRTFPSWSTNMDGRLIGLAASVRPVWMNTMCSAR
jgi:hypothetical protein